MSIRSSVALIAIVGVALLVGSCRESEQGRILFYEKGTYLGKREAPLTDDQAETLRQRATRQRPN